MYKNGAVVGLDQLRTLLVERGNSVRDVPMPVWQTYQNAVLRVRCTPKTRSNLELLIAGYSDLTESYQGVMNSLTKYRHPASDPIASKILSMRRQLEVYKGLRFYETEAGKKRIYHLVKCRFERSGNAELAHLVPRHAMERVDPLNQTDAWAHLQAKFDDWLKSLGGQDPSEHPRRSPKTGH